MKRLVTHWFLVQHRQKKLRYRKSSRTDGSFPFVNFLEYLRTKIWLKKFEKINFFFWETDKLFSIKVKFFVKNQNYQWNCFIFEHFCKLWRKKFTFSTPYCVPLIELFSFYMWGILWYFLNNDELGYVAVHHFMKCTNEAFQQALAFDARRYYEVIVSVFLSILNRLLLDSVNSTEEDLQDISSQLSVTSWVLFFDPHPRNGQILRQYV